MKRILSSGFLCLLAAISAGCKNDCVQVCEYSQDCGYSDFDESFLGNASCGDLCDLSEEFAELVNCEAEWNAFVSCTADNLPPGCGQVPEGSCRGEADAYSRCFDFN